jgi:ribosomal protein S18 acetylase RimI-like enzyme
MRDLIDIRRLGPEDASLAINAIRVLKTGPEVAAEVGLYGWAWLAQPANVLMVATQRSNPIGFALGYLLDRVDAAHPMLFLYEIDVAAPYRRRGIGRHLVEAMKAVACAHGVLKMWVQTSPSNLAAQALYRSTGGMPHADVDLLYVWTNEMLHDPKFPVSAEDPGTR